MPISPPSDQPYWVYILECQDGSFYTGISNHVEARLKLHNSGKGAKYTNARRPVVLVYTEECSSRSGALKREHAIKQLSRRQKEKLVMCYI
jgi:putative endonuclease